MQEISSSWDGRPFNHNRYRPKSGGCCAPFGEGWVPSNTMSVKAYLRAKWHLNPSSHLVTISMGRGLYGRIAKVWRGAVLLSVGGRAGSSSNTMWPGSRLTSIPSGILIHPTIWPLYTNVTDRTDRQTTVGWNSARTVLQTVARNVK